MAELRPPPPLYTNRCGHAHPAISPFKDHSPTTRNVLIKYSLQIIPFGLMFLFPPLFWFGKAKNGGRELRVGGKGGPLPPCFDQTVGRLVVGGFDRHAVIPCFCSLAAACGSLAQLMFDFGCFLELQPGMCCSKDKRAIRQTAANQETEDFMLYCAVSVIFLHFQNTQWNLAAMNNYCLPNLPSFKYIIPSSACHPLLCSQSLLCWIQYQVVYILSTLNRDQKPLQQDLSASAEGP